MADEFALSDFLFVTMTCAIGVLVLGIGWAGLAFSHIGLGSRLVLAALLLISPTGPLTTMGSAIAVAILGMSWLRARLARRSS